jgi:hypothetical protein
MPRHTHLLRRGSQYYVNVKVPQDLRRVLKKDIIRKSLHTSDSREAVRRVRIESLRIHAEFEETRAKSRPDQTQLRDLSAVSEHEGTTSSFDTSADWRKCLNIGGKMKPQN